jgi:hypothetical protein
MEKGGDDKISILWPKFWLWMEIEILAMAVVNSQ